MNVRRLLPGLAALAFAAPAGAAENGFLLTVANQDYPYSGFYAATRGDDCVEDQPLTKDDMDLIVAGRAENGVTSYFAIPLHVDLKTAVAEPQQVQADGSLKGFATEKFELFGTKVTYETRVSLKPLDAEHVLVTEWTVTYLDSDGNVTDVFDNTKAGGGDYGGKEHENGLGLEPGKNGVCLKRVGEVPG